MTTSEPCNSIDTTLLANIAEERISYELLRAGLLVAKPKFDQMGTDLLAFMNMHDGVKFCRIQCKGRSVANSSANIKIPERYVTDGFVVILNVTDASKTETLFCFFSSDIKQWARSPDSEYQLTLVASTFQVKLTHYQFYDSKIRLIETIIATAQTSGEFRSLIYGNIASTLGPVKSAAHGVVKNPM